MPSHGLSSRRSYLPRPAVCKASPPLPVVPPDFPCVCAINNGEIEQYTAADDAEVLISACSPGYEDGIPLEAEITATAGDVGDVNDFFNCTPGGEFDYNAPEEPQFVRFELTVTFPEGETCGASVLAEIIEDD